MQNPTLHFSLSAYSRLSCLQEKFIVSCVGCIICTSTVPVTGLGLSFSGCGVVKITGLSSGGCGVVNGFKDIGAEYVVEAIKLLIKLLKRTFLLILSTYFSFFHRTLHSIRIQLDIHHIQFVAVDFVHYH